MEEFFSKYVYEIFAWAKLCTVAIVLKLEIIKIRRFNKRQTTKNTLVTVFVLKSKKNRHSESINGSGYFH